MPYDYHIFISHRRTNPDLVRWTRECFLRPLRSHLGIAIPGLRIFFDDQIETGASWPDALADAHARSRILVPILHPDYFSSLWCRLELALMMERERSLGWRTADDPRHLIFPVIINGAERFPANVRAIQAPDMSPHANFDMQPGTPAQMLFTDAIRQWAHQLETVLLVPPDFDHSWRTAAHDQFQNTFQIHTAVQTTTPTLANIILPT
jgi:hypothetical protein